MPLVWSRNRAPPIKEARYYAPERAPASGGAGYNRGVFPRSRKLDSLIAAADQALRTLTVPPPAARPSPAGDIPDADMDPEARRRSIALMRVNHAGEIAAQALYRGQSLLARSDETRRHLLEAAAEEQDHLAWCAQRLEELDGRPSRLDPLWYAGSFLVGMAGLGAGRPHQSGVRCRDGAAGRSPSGRSPFTVAR